MLGHRTMSIDDYVGILRRHLWKIVIPTLVLPALAYGVSLFLPERYTSTTVVLVEQPKVPSNIVATTVKDSLTERLNTMQQQILSRTRLAPMIEQFGLYKEDVAGKVPMEDLVNKMRKAITVTPVKTIMSTKQGEMPGFTISFEADTPQKAQLVCQEITGLYIKENANLRAERAKDTTDFLKKQVEDAKRTLDEKDQRVSDFKRKYLGMLPGQENVNQQVLTGLTAQLEATNQILARTHQDKTYAESQLAQQVAAWEASQQGTNPQTMETQLATLQNQLVTLQGRYTDDHPDVQKLKADIAQLKKKIDEANATAKTASPDKEKSATAKAIEPPQIQQLRNMIHAFDITLAEKTREQDRIQNQIKVYRARVESAPLVEQQYNEILRDYTTAQGFYDDLLKKRGTSQVAEDLEIRSQGEQFRVVDPPNLPANPTFPNRLLFAAGGLAGGLGIGFALALVMELKDKSLRTEADIEALLQLPTLALVPSVLEGAHPSRGLLSRLRKTPERALTGSGA